MHGARGFRLCLRAPCAKRPEEPGPRRQIHKNLMVELDERRKALVAAGQAALRLRPRRPEGADPRRSSARRSRAAVPEVSQYPSAFGTAGAARAPWPGTSRRRFGVDHRSPRRRCSPAHGAKEAIFHLPLAFAGDPRRRKVVMPDPGYPTYEVGARFAGLEPVKVPLTRRATASSSSRRTSARPCSRETLALLGELPAQPHRRGRAARLPRARRARRRGEHGFVVASDECYADVYFGAPPALDARGPGRERRRHPLLLEAQRHDRLPERLPRRRPRPRGGAAARCAATRASPRPSSSRPRRRPPGPTTPTPAERREIFRRKRDRFLRFFAEHGLARRRVGGDAVPVGARCRPGETCGELRARASSTRGSWSRRAPPSARARGTCACALVPTLEECEEAIEAWSKGADMSDWSDVEEADRGGVGGPAEARRSRRTGRRWCRRCDGLDRGELRVAEKAGGEWKVNAWLMQAVNLYFAVAGMEVARLRPVPVRATRSRSRRTSRRRASASSRAASSRYGALPRARRGGHARLREHRRARRRGHDGRHLGHGRLLRAGGRERAPRRRRGHRRRARAARSPPQHHRGRRFIGSRCILVEGVLVEEEAVLGRERGHHRLDADHRRHRAAGGRATRAASRRARWSSPGRARRSTRRAPTRSPAPSSSAGAARPPTRRSRSTRRCATSRCRCERARRSRRARPAGRGARARATEALCADALAHRARSGRSATRSRPGRGRASRASSGCENSLVVRVDGPAASRRAGPLVALCGHLDTVPVHDERPRRRRGARAARLVAPRRLRHEGRRSR